MILKRRTFLQIVPAAAIATQSGLAYADDEKKEGGGEGEVLLKFGTVAPKNSLWGSVFKTWTEIYNEKAKSKGLKTRIMFFYSAQQGDESEMVGKIRKGQLDGAAITAVGLAAIEKSALVFQMPGLFQDWPQLDAVREKLRPQLEKAFNDAGFACLGWGDVGKAHTVSKGFEVRVPTDLRGRHPIYIKGDMIAPVFYSVVDKVTPIETTIPQIATQLAGGAIDILNTPSLALEQLMWAQHVDTINEAVTGFGIGAMVMSSKKLAALGEDDRTILKETGAKAADTLTKVIRNEDKKAFERLLGSKKHFMPSESELAQWKKVFADSRARLAGSTFPAAFVKQVEEAAAAAK